MTTTKNFAKGSDSYLLVLEGPVSGYDIREFSQFPTESEVLLEPETTIEISGTGRNDDVIQCKVVPTDPILLSLAPYKDWSISPEEMILEKVEGMLKTQDYDPLADIMSKKIISWKMVYDDVVKKEDADMLFALGKCYDYVKGDELPKDPKRAADLYQRAADLDNPSAMTNLAVCYMNGDGVRVDPGRAFELFETASKAGIAKAINNLGYCYRNGKGVAKDLNKAFELYQRAADMSDAGAVYNLALCCYRGEGVRKNKKRAIELWQRGASLGDEDSIKQLEKLGESAA